MSWFRGVVDSVLGRSKGPTRDSSIREAIDISIARTKSPPKRDAIALLAAYSAMPRLRAVVDLIGNKVAATPWTAYRTRGMSPRQVNAALRKAVDGKPHTAHREVRAATLKSMQDAGLVQQLDAHPVLDFLDRPTDFFNAHDARKMMVIHRELIGESFAAIERFRPTREGVIGRPAELWPFPPSDVVELPCAANDDCFKVRMPSGAHRFIHRRDAIWMRDADPANPYGRGVGIARTLANELDVDEYAAQTAAALFYNNGVPDTIVSVPGIGESEGERLKERLREQHGGHLKVRVPYITDSADLKVQRLSQSFADMGLVQLRDAEAKIIRQTWGVPPESLGDVSNSNRATITQSDIILARLVLVPRLESWADEINSRLVPEWGDRDVFVAYESPVPTDADLELAYATTFGWARTFDEARRAQGLPEKGGKAGGLHLVPAGMVLVDPEALAAKPAVVEGADAADAATDDTTSTADGATEATGENLDLNGSLVNSALAIIVAAAEGTLPRETAIALLVYLYGLTREEADEILGDIGRGFVPVVAADQETAPLVEPVADDEVAEEKRLLLRAAIEPRLRSVLRQKRGHGIARGAPRHVVLARVRRDLPETRAGREVLAAVAAQFGRRGRHGA